MTTVDSWLKSNPLPVLEKRILLEFVTGLNRVQQMTRSDRVLTEDELGRLNNCSERHQNGEPIPYITGVQEFFSRPFQVNSATLIPRPDTECLVEWLIENMPKGANVVDLGTGTGCIAITCALERRDCKVSASDISADALAVAKKNCQKLNANVQFYCGSWLEAFPSTHHIDVLVSNPPYIRHDDKHLDALTYEPIDALTDHGDGLSCYEAILLQASKRMSRPVMIAFEHGWDQGDEVRAIFSRYGFIGAETLKDYGGNDRFTVWNKV